MIIKRVLMFHLKVKMKICSFHLNQMISTLQSLDNLLNRFDELSQCHSNLLSEFGSKLSEYKNPLRDVTRTKEEQRQTQENLRSTINESRLSIASSGPLEDFHRRVWRSRHLHRPPNYSLNDQSLIPNIPSKSSFTTIESLSPSKVLPVAKIPKISQPRPTREAITVFSMDTINRLSKPKRYNRLPEVKSPTKKSPKIPPSTIKRPKVNLEKPSPKKIKEPMKIPRSVNTSEKPIKRSMIPSKVQNISFTSIKKLPRRSVLPK